MDKKSPDYLSALPPELLYAIVRSLDFRSVVNLRPLSRNLCKVANGDLFRNVAIQYDPRSISSVYEVAKSSTSDLIKKAIFYSAKLYSSACAGCEWRAHLIDALSAMPNLVEAALTLSINRSVGMANQDHYRCGGPVPMPPDTDHLGRDAVIFLEALGVRASIPGIKHITYFELEIINIRPIQKLMLDECRGNHLSTRFQAIIQFFRHLETLKFDMKLPVHRFCFTPYAECEYTMLLQAASSLCTLELCTTVHATCSETILDCKHFTDLFHQPTPPWPQLTYLSIARLYWNTTTVAIVRCHASSLRSLTLTSIEFLEPGAQQTWRDALVWLAEILTLTELSLQDLIRQARRPIIRPPMPAGNFHRVFNGRGGDDTTNDYQAVQDYILHGKGSIPPLDEGLGWLAMLRVPQRT
nr:hypothetical protein CFP56_50925 [Quercus suber]